MVGIALHSVVPLRKEPQETSEMLTQMLFAQTCDILQELPRWLKVRIHADGQEGFADRKMITPIEELKPYLTQQFPRVAFPLAYALSVGNGQTVPLTMGTTLPGYKNGEFSIEEAHFRIEQQFVQTKPLTLNLENLQKITRFLLNTPYLWGGKSALGMDCSGMTQVVMSMFGINLLRNASEQATQGVTVNLLEEAQAGDLAFFGKDKITHVGILLSTDTIIHCSGRVKVERIDSKGIIALGTNEYTHDLKSIRRYEQNQ